MSVTVASVSAKWMINRNRCDTTEICFTAHLGKAYFHPGSKLPDED